MTSGWSERMAGIGLSQGDSRELLANARSFADGTKGLQDRLNGVVGRAESEDGRIRAGFSNEKGVEELTIEPRALREGSEGLAETIRAVIADARADFIRQLQEIVREGYGEEPEPTEMVAEAEEMRNQVEEMGEIIRQSSTQIFEVFERFQQQLDEGIDARIRPEQSTDD